jgi:hypothetical protein
MVYIDLLGVQGHLSGINPKTQTIHITSQPDADGFFTIQKVIISGSRMNPLITRSRHYILYDKQNQLLGISNRVI